MEEDVCGVSKCEGRRTARLWTWVLLSLVGFGSWEGWLLLSGRVGGLTSSNTRRGAKLEDRGVVVVVVVALGDGG